MPSCLYTGIKQRTSPTGHTGGRGKGGRKMIKLEVTPNHYYQERYENNEYRITNGPMRGYLIWKDGEIVRAVNTIQEAEKFTNNN